MSERIILFDGLCNLCSASVKFIIRNDPEGGFKFATLQSDFGQEILRNLYLSSQHLETLVLIENDRIFIKSTAALKIAKRLKGIWPALYVFIIIPKAVRNFVYDILAKNRFSFFGQKESCMIPGKEIQNRFIEDNMLG